MLSLKEFGLSILQFLYIFYVKVLLFFKPEERIETFEYVFSGVPAR